MNFNGLSGDLDNRLLQNQVYLLSQKCKVDLGLYEKNAMNKINNFSYLGKNYVCSCQDKFKKIRIPIIALLIKILKKNTISNLQKFKRIKQLVYASNLEEIVRNHAITLKQLQTHFATVINSLEVGTQKIQSLLIKKINSEPFFDRIIMDAFYEKFIENGQEKNLTSSISKWVKEQLNVSIAFTKNQFQNENDELIILRKNQYHQVLYRLSSFNVCSMTSIEQDTLNHINKTSPNLKYIQKRALNTIETDEVLNSISQSQSPTRRFSRNSKHKPNQIYQSISMQNSVELQPISTKTLLIGGKQNQQLKIIKRPLQNQSKLHNNESSFWNLFCCRGD